MSLSHDPPNGGKKPIRPPLRLVHPSSPKPLSKGRKPAIFAPDETARIRAALVSSRRTFGTWVALASAMGLDVAYVYHVKASRRLTGDFAIRLARALGVPLESLTRAPTDASTCPACGARRTP